jgi:exodeoxyribonuclease VII large subunit
MSKEGVTLFELNQRIRGVLDDAMLTSIWVKAEISELRVNRNGHCYLDLVEKDEQTDQLRARSRAMIWSQNFRMLKAYFESTTKQTLTTGLKILVKVTVQFQEVFGFSLIITDIDPSYTMGDLTRKRQEVLTRLQEEGVIDMNKELFLPEVIQKIAIISSPTAAGYGDFIEQLENNPYQIRFYHHLFPAIMQGDRAESSIESAFDRIFDHADFFDAVVLIRGGGASSDLLCFDSYWVAYLIAQFPLPVITGIGHERDESVADLVANTRQKTPTAVASFLIDRAGVFLQMVDEKTVAMARLARDIIRIEKQRTENLAASYVPGIKMDLQRRANQLERQMGRLPVSVSRRIGNADNSINRYSDRLVNVSQQFIGSKRHMLLQHQQLLMSLSKQRLFNENKKLKYSEQTARLNDPQKLLERGYSLTYLNGRLVKDVESVKKGDEISTRLNNGFLIGHVEKTIKKIAKK